MLDHLGEEEAAAAIVGAIERALAEGPPHPDIGGKADTVDSARRSREWVRLSGTRSRSVNVWSWPGLSHGCPV